METKIKIPYEDFKELVKIFNLYIENDSTYKYSVVRNHVIEEGLYSIVVKRVDAYNHDTKSYDKNSAVEFVIQSRPSFQE